MRNIQLEISHFQKPDPQVVLWNLKIFFSQLMRHRLSEDGYHAIPKQFLVLKNRREDRYGEPLRLADYAREMNCSAPHLTRKFKLRFGSSPSQMRKKLDSEKPSNCGGSRSASKEG